MTQIKEIAYGYLWNCATCGTENAYGLTDEEADDYNKEWEEDNADAVAEGETGEGACDWWYNVTARKRCTHRRQRNMLEM